MVVPADALVLLRGSALKTFRGCQALSRFIIEVGCSIARHRCGLLLSITACGARAVALSEDKYCSIDEDASSTAQEAHFLMEMLCCLITGHSHHHHPNRLCSSQCDAGLAGGARLAEHPTRDFTFAQHISMPMAG